MKDTLERTREPNFDLKKYLADAYVHPVFKDGDDDDTFTNDEKKYDDLLVATKRQSRRNTPVPSKYNGSSPPSLHEVAEAHP